MSGVKRQVPSPCVRNCCLNDEDVCLGCFRSLDEITRWNETSDAERLAILQQTQLRRATHVANVKRRLR